MPSLRYLYRIGHGPSSSHTMGPVLAAERFYKKNPSIKSVTVELCGSLSATGKGHFTDKAIEEYFANIGVLSTVEFTDKVLDFHPNGLIFHGKDADGTEIAQYVCFSVGGGALIDTTVDAGAGADVEAFPVYPVNSMSKIRAICNERGITFPEYVFEQEAAYDRFLLDTLPPTERARFVPFREFLLEVLATMMASIERGLRRTGRLPGEMRYPRKAAAMHRRALLLSGKLRAQQMPIIYAIAVSEENASVGRMVTAPTCGSCGVLPAVLRHMNEDMPEVASDENSIAALAVAGLIGNLAKVNASISGAELGCQAEIGVACSMAAGAASYMSGGSLGQIEAAAEVGLEHNLGLTCDPVDGFVIVPCIERNGMCAVRAINCARMTALIKGTPLINLDMCIATMRRTGIAMHADYKETSFGGLAQIVRERGLAPATFSDWLARFHGSQGERPIYDARCEDDDDM
eukprot:gnl/Chilomastix_cuspidata/3193.p1 GENE.gnl/Chilomastix_cuspidata/3193~~gnl/Chilomastix_cuspidata/3193.p1  ORF type:complete len:502 (-),score=194.17 gnl/Chilomastix_cuspidata/3193:1195-2577(-)